MKRVLYRMMGHEIRDPGCLYTDKWDPHDLEHLCFRCWKTWGLYGHFRYEYRQQLRNREELDRLLT